MSGPYDRWPTGSGFDKFYGFIGGETNQWAPAIFDGVTRVETPQTPGYHFTTDMTNKAINWVSAQQIAHAGQAVLHVLRHRRDARAAPRAEGVDREIQGPVQRRLGQASRGDLRAAEEAGRDSGGHEAHAASEGDSRVGRHERAAEAALRAADGNLRRVRRAHRRRGRPARGAAREDRRAGQHAVLLHRRRQRLERRGRTGRHLQRDDGAQRHRRQSRPDDGPHRRVGRSRRRSRTSPSAGRGRATRRSSGPSRSPVTSAARATAW